MDIPCIAASKIAVILQYDWLTGNPLQAMTQADWPALKNNHNLHQGIPL